MCCCWNCDIVVVSICHIVCDYVEMISCFIIGHYNVVFNVQIHWLNLIEKVNRNITRRFANLCIDVHYSVCVLFAQVK